MIERLECTRPEDVERRDVNDLAPDPRWIDGNVALLGDACHAVQPNLGQGGGQVRGPSLFLLSCQLIATSNLAVTYSGLVCAKHSASSRRWFSPWSLQR